MLQPPETAKVPPLVPSADPIAPLRAALRGHYDIEREIGQGAFATVYLARDLKHERKVALKVLNADPTSETGELRFIREIRTLARLQHPNILPLHDSGHVEAFLYYVMPYVKGDTLRDRIDREKQMSVESACAIVRDVADALAYAHAQGIIHRDIKPENILLSTGHPILADFGIARAIDVGGVRQLTRTGAASPGTPAYMSPEQLLGDSAVDGRSDIYSLAFVLFEMLTGRPPFAGKEAFVKRFTEAPPKVSAFRKGLPEWVDGAVARALQRDPNDRYESANEFKVALCPPDLSPAGHSGVAEVPQSAPLRGRSRLQAPAGGRALPGRWLEWVRGVRLPSLRILVPGAVVAALAVGAVARGRDISSAFRPRRLDPSRLAVLPFRGDRDQADVVTRNFEEALGRWQDLSIASGVEVADALPAGTFGASLKDLRGIASRLAAGRLVWGEVSRTGRVKAELYDMASSANGPVRSVILDSALAAPDAAARASTAILKKPDIPETADGADAGTRSYAAWTAYGEGHKALESWNLGQAKEFFGKSVSRDPRFSAAQSWLAQILQWTSPDSAAEWKAHAIAAQAGTSALSERDRLIGLAVGALATGAYPEACARYAELVRLDSLSFIGWYGAGECRRLDKSVIADSKSASGWRFRSSVNTATNMYQRALQLEPRGHSLLTFDLLQDLLPTGTNMVRTGQGPDSAIFVAYPSLSADTLAFTPYSIERFAALPIGSNRSQNLALKRNSDLLLRFATAWARQFPVSPDAYEALADILEARGEVSGAPQRAQSALSTTLRARALTTDPHQQLRLATREVRLRIKRSEFARAGALADSLLAQNAAPAAGDAIELLGLAALTGKISRTAQLSRGEIWPLAVGRVTIAPLLGEAAANLFANAALGVCGSGTSSLEVALEKQLQSYVPESQRREVRAVLATRSFSMLAPCTDARSALKIEAPRDRLYRMQRAFAQHDQRTVRAILDTLAQMRQDLRPGDLTLDYTYQEAWLRAALGDTAAAIRQLDLALNALPSLNGNSLKDPGVAAALGRSFGLRADLAFGQRDLRAAKLYAVALLALWRTADLPLQPTVMRMRRLASLTPS